MALAENRLDSNKTPAKGNPRKKRVLKSSKKRLAGKEEIT